MGNAKDLLGSLDSFGDFVVGSEVIEPVGAPGSPQEASALGMADGAGVSVDGAQGCSAAAN